MLIQKSMFLTQEFLKRDKKSQSEKYGNMAIQINSESHFKIGPHHCCCWSPSLQPCGFMAAVSGLCPLLQTTFHSPFLGALRKAWPSCDGGDLWVPDLDGVKNSSSPTLMRWGRPLSLKKGTGQEVNPPIPFPCS